LFEYPLDYNPGMHDEKVRWYVVSLRTSSSSPVLDALAGSWSVVAPHWPARCVCCSADTPYKMQFTPDGSQYSARPFLVGRCRDCLQHVATKAPSVLFMLSALLAAGLCVGYGITQSTPFWISPAPLIVGGIVAWAIRQARQRRRLQKQGHYSGFEIVPGPGRIALRTTNPQLANEFRELNTHR
jgi:hypothetical protein